MPTTLCSINWSSVSCKIMARSTVFPAEEHATLLIWVQVLPSVTSLFDLLLTHEKYEGGQKKTGRCRHGILFEMNRQTASRIPPQLFKQPQLEQMPVSPGCLGSGGGRRVGVSQGISKTQAQKNAKRGLCFKFSKLALVFIPPPRYTVHGHQTHGWRGD